MINKKTVSQCISSDYCNGWKSIKEDATAIWNTRTKTHDNTPKERGGEK